MLPIYEALDWQSSIVEDVQIDKVAGQITAIREVHPISSGFRLVREQISTSVPMHYLPFENTDYIGVCFVFTDTNVAINDLAYRELYHDDLNITNGYRFKEQTLRVVNKPLHYIGLQFDNDFVHQLAQKQAIPNWLSQLARHRDDQILDRLDIPLSIKNLAWQACCLPPTQKFSDTLHMQSKALQWLASVLEVNNNAKDSAPFNTDSVFVEKNRAKQFVANTCDIIHSHYSQPLTINELANQVGTNECYLKQYFKTYTGQSIHDYLTQYRLEQANRMLISYPSLKVKIIAELCGYQAAHFSHLFKNTYGLTPSQYRQKSLTNI